MLASAAMVNPAPLPQEPSRPSPAWWLYLGLLALFAFGGMLANAVQFSRTTLPPTAIAISAVARTLNLIGLLGLLLYILGRPLVGRAFWQAVFGLTVLQFLFGASQFVRVLGMTGGGRESMVAWLGLGGLAVGLPLLYVLWAYAFRSAHLWVRAAADPSAPGSTP